MTTPATERPEVGQVDRILDQRREAGSLALLERQADLAQLTDDEFERRLTNAKKGYERMQRIFDTLMVDGVHYGTKRKDGKTNVFQTPDLTLEGAQLLRQVYRLTPELVGDPQIKRSVEYCEATATVQLRDAVGRIVAVRSATCNSQEPRFFERPKGRGREDQAAGPIGEEGPDEELPPQPDAQTLKADKRGRPLYTDAREVIHQCIAMAEKRGAKLATADATGVTAFLKDKTRERMQKATAAAGFVAWSQEEKAQVYKAAERAGVKKKAALREIVVRTVGHEPPSTGDEVTKVLAALAVYTAPEPEKKESAAKPVKDAAPGTTGELGLEEQQRVDREEDAELLRKEREGMAE